MKEPKNTNTMSSMSPRQIMQKRFSRHKAAVGALFLLQVLYLVAIFAEFFAPYPSRHKNIDYAYCPPQIPEFSFEKGLYVNQYTPQIDPVTLRKTYIKSDEVTELSFFAKSRTYRLLGLIKMNRKFAGIKNQIINKDKKKESTFFLIGADKYGRDIFSRIIYGARISLSIGIIAIIVTFSLGLSIGAVSGYLGGIVDNLIQRVIEIINSIPKLPLWLSFGAIMPDDWSPLQIYFAITVVLSLLGWTRLARVVRGKILSLREEDYAVAAYLLGAKHKRIIFKHLLPGFTSHIIVSVTLTIPWMILGETTLSFLGVGLRPPVVSWGVMLQDCMNMTTVANYPWLLVPVVMIIITVLSFNFLGDGLRDAADPYS